MYEHIKAPYTFEELKARIASNEYNAELLLQHAMLLLESKYGAQSRLHEGTPVDTGSFD